MSEKAVYHNFQKRTDKLRNVVALIRSSCYSHGDEGGMNIILCPECEEWTHVSFNMNSGLLDLLGDLTVESIDAEDGDILLWIKTDDYNWFRTDWRANDDQRAADGEDYANKAGD